MEQKKNTKNKYYNQADLFKNLIIRGRMVAKLEGAADEFYGIKFIDRR